MNQEELPRTERLFGAETMAILARSQLVLRESAAAQRKETEP